MELSGERICEIEDHMIDEIDYGDWEEYGWDDIKGVQLPAELVSAGRHEEVGFMEKRSIWGIRDVAEC